MESATVGGRQEDSVSSAGLSLPTPRLRLRELREDDFDSVHAYAADPEVVQYMPWGPNTEQDTRDFLQRASEAAAVEPRRSHELAVTTRGDGRLIGAVGLHVDADGSTAMLGYCVHPNVWGRGYATEAAEAMLGFGFDVLLLHRIWAGCDPGNVASARVLQKLGMTLEGQLRQDTRIRGEWRDSWIFGILRHEWTERSERQ